METSANFSSNSILQDFVACQSVFIVFFSCILVILLPLFVFTVVVGSLQWRKRRSNPTAETISHSDIITFNIVALEFVAILGMCFYLYGFFYGYMTVLKTGFYVLSIMVPGQTLFHVLTCVERYLAVVHPVTYVGLKQPRGVRIRNISIGCVWGICFAVVFAAGEVLTLFIVNFVILLASSAVVCFCSLSVLRVLVRPVQRDVGGNRERVDPRRHKVFHAIAVITGVLLVRMLGFLVYVLLKIASTMSKGDECLVSWTAAWLSLPSSLVLPLLFLHRAGKLRGCKQSTATG